jgi:hypothetical protein
LDYITLHDLVLGKHGDHKLDLGWNYNEGVYSSADANTVGGVASFVSADVVGATKVTVEQNGEQLVIKLYAGERLVAKAEIGRYATINLTNHTGDDLGTLFLKSDEKGFCEFTAPKINDYVAEYDKLIIDSRNSSFVKTVYYSEVDLWDGVSVSTFLKGSGTEADPYLVESGADLAYIAKVVNEAAAKTANFKGMYFKMTKSIDLNGHELLIGKYSANLEFHGFFDGNHCSVRGINATQSLFGILKNGYIKNLSTYGIVQTTEKVGVAGVVSYLANANVENLTSYVNVTGVQQVAGIVGWLAQETTAYVINCTNYGTITATSYQIGGIAGFAKGIIRNCTNYGNVTSQGSYVGGIGGSAKDAKCSEFVNCNNYGTISGQSYVGGLFGLVNKPLVDCNDYSNQ